jgi:class 3 adenylate cyclase
LVYLAIVAAFGVAYGTLVYLVSERWGAQTVAGSAYTFAAGFLASLLIGIPLHGYVQRRLDAVLTARSARARSTLRALLAEMATSTDLAGLVRRALEAVTTDLDLARAALFLVAADHKELVLADARGEHPEQERLAMDHPVVRMLSALHVELTRRTLATHPRYASIRDAGVALFTRLGADLLLPIEVEGELVGLLALGESPDVGPLDPDEVDLLRALAAEIGLCVVRARDAERLRAARLDLERFARFLPRSVAADVLGGKLPGEGGRRRQVTIVVCEVRGFTALAEGIEPEELAQALGRYHALAADETAKGGGTLARVRGGQVVAVFGDPEAVPDHGRRAVLMATSVIRQARDLWAPWTHASAQLAVRAGMATGFATVGFIAVGPRLDYHVIGRAMLTARELAARAGTDEILMTASTLATAGADIVTEEVDDAEGSAGAVTQVHRLIAIESSTASRATDRPPDAE